MTSPVVVNSKDLYLLGSLPAEQELILLETLKSLLDGAGLYLSGGDALPLLEVSQQISSAAQALLACSVQPCRSPATPEAQEKRRQLLVELGQQRSFCRAMLRRWRRSLALRRQLLDIDSEPVPYTGAFCQLEES